MTSIIFFKFNKNLWWAFKQMGMHKTYFENIDGLIFYKMLGTGSSPGFSMYPDFSTYALPVSYTHLTLPTIYSV